MDFVDIADLNFGHHSHLSSKNFALHLQLCNFQKPVSHTQTVDQCKSTSPLHHVMPKSFQIVDYNFHTLEVPFHGNHAFPLVNCDIHCNQKRGSDKTAEVDLMTVNHLQGNACM